MEGGHDFFVHLLSDASLDYFPNNKISNFRNKLATSLDLEHNAWQVALTECSYMPPDIIVHEGEIVGTISCDTYGEQIPKSFLKIMGVKRYTNRGIETDILAPTNFKSIHHLLSFLQTLDNSAFAIEGEEYLKQIFPEKYYKQFPYNIEYSPKIQGMLGFHDGFNEKKHYIQFSNISHVVTGKEKPRMSPILIDIENQNTLKIELQQDTGSSNINHSFYAKQRDNEPQDSFLVYIMNKLKEDEYILDWKITKEDFLEYSQGLYMHKTFSISFEDWHFAKNVGFDGGSETTVDEVSQLIKTRGKAPMAPIFLCAGNVIGEIGLRKTSTNDEKYRFGVTPETKTKSVDNIEYYVKQLESPVDFYSFNELADFVANIQNCEWRFDGERIKFLFSSKKNNNIRILKFQGLAEHYLGFQNSVDLEMGPFNPLKINHNERVGKHKVFERAGSTRLFIYSDLVVDQYVGDMCAPLLRSMPLNSNAGVLHTQYFQNPYYLPLRLPYVEMIHIYIRNESGRAPPFDLGSFACTLHFQKK